MSFVIICIRKNTHEIEYYKAKGIFCLHEKALLKSLINKNIIKVCQ
jgi:hypothetical protein